MSDVYAGFSVLFLVLAFLIVLDPGPKAIPKNAIKTFRLYFIIFMDSVILCLIGVALAILSLRATK